MGISLYQDALKFLSREVLKLNGSMINCLGAWPSVTVDLQMYNANATKNFHKLANVFVNTARVRVILILYLNICRLFSAMLCLS